MPAKKKLDIRQLDELCKIQCTQEEICAVLGMCKDTINAHLREMGFEGFSRYFKEKSKVGLASLRRVQFSMAQKQPVMAIFLGKNYLNQWDKDPRQGETRDINVNVSFGGKKYSTGGDDGGSDGAAVVE